MIRFGVVGCGAISPSHGEAINNVKNAKLMACCDLIEEKAKAFAEKYGAEKIYTDYHQMLKSDEIDVVCVCTPSGLHGQVVLDAVKARKHIVCEKPIEITTKSLDAIVKAIEKSNVKMACVFQRRWQTSAIKLKQIIQNGDFGKVLIADTYLKWYREPAYYKSADWRGKWELDGGGALMNQGIHGIDLIQWLMGGVESVFAITETKLHDIEVEDTALACVRYKNGAVGVIEGTTCVYPSQDVKFELHFEKGSIIFSDKGILLWERKDGVEDSEISKQIIEDGLSGKDNYYAAKLSHEPIYEDIIEAIENDTETEIPPLNGRAAVDIILAIYESGKTHKEIML